MTYPYTSSSYERDIAEWWNPKYTLNAKEVLYSALPKLLHEPGRSTKSSALKQLRYNGPLEPWRNFDGEILQFYVDHKDTFHRMRTVPVAPKSLPVPQYTLNEHVYNGMEITLSGRFFQNVLIPVTCAYRTVCRAGRPTFGDSRVAALGMHGSKEPDIVMIDVGELHQSENSVIREAKFARHVGELKAFWVQDHNLDAIFRGYRSDRTFFDRVVRLLIGQLCDYMYRYSLRFGFITTYEHIVFLKQDIQPGTEGSTCFYFSTVLSSEIARDIGDAPTDRTITVRMAMMWLVAQTASSARDCDFSNRTERASLFSEMPKDSGQKGNQRNTPAHSKQGSGARQPGGMSQMGSSQQPSGQATQQSRPVNVKDRLVKVSSRDVYESREVAMIRHDPSMDGFFRCNDDGGRIDQEHIPYTDVGLVQGRLNKIKGHCMRVRGKWEYCTIWDSLQDH